MYLSKDRGGVGLRKLRLMNKALHAKRIWRYKIEKKALWRGLVQQKLGGNNLALFPNSSKCLLARACGQSF